MDVKGDDTLVTRTRMDGKRGEVGVGGEKIGVAGNGMVGIRHDAGPDIGVLAALRDDLEHLGGTHCRGAEHNRNPRVDDSGLLAGNLGECVAQNRRMVEGDTCKRAANRGNGARRVPTTAQPDLQDGVVHVLKRIHHKGGGSKELKLRDALGAHVLIASGNALPGGKGVAHAEGEELLPHRLAVDLHTLRIAHKMRARVKADLATLRMEQGRSVARRRRLAVGTGHLNALVGVLGMAELGKQAANRCKRGVDAESQRRLDALYGLRKGQPFGCLKRKRTSPAH